MTCSLFEYSHLQGYPGMLWFWTSSMRKGGVSQGHIIPYKQYGTQFLFSQDLIWQTTRYRMDMPQVNLP